MEMANPHTAEELARLSTLVHNLAGWLALLVSLVLMGETLRGVPPGRIRFLWPSVAVFIGFGLTGYVFIHMIVTHRVSPFAVSMQVQHQLIGLCLGTGALIELLGRRRRSGSWRWRLAWPLSLVGVGALFLVHEQGTAEAMVVHWMMAASFIVAGFALLAVILSGGDSRALAVFGVLLLGSGALQLIVFDEVPGAHADHAPARH